ncbi:MAG: P-loop NTPase [Pseudomonadota bacterium]
MAVSQEQVLEALRRVKGPDLESNVVDLGLVSEPAISSGKVSLSVSVDPARAQELEPMRQACESVLLQLDGVDAAMVVLTAERATGDGGPRAGGGPSRPPQGPARGRAAPGPGGGLRRATGVPGVRHMIAVASGKGGVGKSTTAVNLALALQAQGLTAGILDADIYGPSQPRLLGLSGKPQTATDGKRLRPMEAFGLKVMSMGFLVDEGTPIIWRGPMVVSALNQMMREVDWGPLDVMVIDMPPGTGDVQLTMAQQVPLAGAVIVSTPQDLALIDARKGLSMFKKVDVPVLGIIENMSYFICPSCGERAEIFGHGGAEHEAGALNVPFLGAVPLHMDIRAKSDLGQPIVASAPDSPHAAVFGDIAARVLAQLDATGATAQSPPVLTLSNDRKSLIVTYEDATSYTLSAELLRVMSPSAEVQGHSPDQRVTVAGKRDVTITDLRPVGNYAVRIVFADGHDTGLFTWTYLKTLGVEQDQRWAAYLAELEAKQMSRDP